MMETAEEELCFPHLVNSSCRKPQTNTNEGFLFDLLLSFISLLTATLNLLVIISIAHFRQLHSSTNLILLSLAVSDFLVGLVVIPALGTVWRSCWFFGDILCALIYLVPSTAVISSLGTIVLISVDRYLAISDPLRYPTRVTGKVVGGSISVCWVYALVYAVSLSLENFYNRDKYRLCDGECTVYISRDPNFIIHFVIPVTIIVVLYIRVFVTAVSQARAIRSHVAALTSKTSKKSEIKAARNLGVVVLVYLMCYSPFYFVYYSETPILIFGVPLQIVMFYLVYLNSSLNPLIYALLYPWFRKAMKLIVTLQILKHGSCDLQIL